LETRIQVCGRVTAEVDGRRIENELPGRQGRLLFVYLVVNRVRTATRDELAAAVWSEQAPSAADAGLSALLSKLRRLVPVEGRSELQLRLPANAWVDLEAAAEGLHRAEAAVARSDWTAAWGPGRVAQHVAARGFLHGEEAPWVEEQRRRLEEIHARALELVGRACLEIGGSELDTAERSARTLIAQMPYRESGHRLLMEALAARGNQAEALLVYEQLRRRLRDDLGASPAPETQALHTSLLRT
jgi:DNA-binding SARP family transcriptional activator